MRTASSYLINLWNSGGPFIGADRAHGRVTVEKDWQLTTDGTVPTDDPRKLPFRWFQRQANDQVETEIPNVKSIAWDRAIDTPAASCTIVFYNQAMDPNMSGQNRLLGRPGHLGWRTPNVNTRANWPSLTDTEWAGVLIPNALLRTYEGYGGLDKTIPQAVADGNIMLTGLWLVDEVKTGNDGTLTLICRDMAKLLIEQIVYPPLYPHALYPLNYQRWNFVTNVFPADNSYDRSNPVESGPGAEGPKWVPDLAISADGAGYWILGTDGGVFAYDVPFYGSRGAGPITRAVALAARPAHDGYWALGIDGSVYGLGAALHLGQQTNWAAPFVQIRATHTGNGYRTMTDDGTVFAFGDAVDLTSQPPTLLRLVDFATRTDDAGYWILAEDGAVYAYGTAPYDGNATIPGGATAAGIAGRPQNDGYWICASDGAVFAFGGASYHGRVTGPSKPITGIVPTASGNGYWLYGQDGGVFAFGDAVFHGNNFPAASPVWSMDRSAAGYWLMEESGAIFSYGDATYYGNPTGAVDLAPMRGIDNDPLGKGYWLCSEDGAVFAYGEAGYYGGANTIGPLGAIIVRIVATPSGRGYWLLGRDGGVFAFGDAVFHGSGVGVVVRPAVDMAATPDGGGYWILTDDGDIYAYGNAGYMGNAPVTPPDKASGIAARPQGDGYWICSENGGVFARGNAQFLSYAQGNWDVAKTTLNDPIQGIDAMPDGNGYILVGGDGGIFAFGSAPFDGSLPGTFTSTQQFPGNYVDFTDIIKDLVLWSGWVLGGSGGQVFGNLEGTGTFAEDGFAADTFDKKPVIDGITAVKELVGFNFWIDEDGGARFESPNWYVYGNFVQETGQRTSLIPEIDERLTLTGYTLSYVDKPMRSEIIITTDDPDLTQVTTNTTIRSISSPLLRGMIRPAMIWVPLQVTLEEQACMAELIVVHMGFQLYQGSVTCAANPAIQMNDQVWIYERVSRESDVHYIRGISSNHDLDTGVWTYTLTTNRLGVGRSVAQPASSCLPDRDIPPELAAS